MTGNSTALSALANAGGSRRNFNAVDVVSQAGTPIVVANFLNIINPMALAAGNLKVRTFPEKSEEDGNKETARKRNASTRTIDISVTQLPPAGATALGAGAAVASEAQGGNAPATALPAAAVTAGGPEVLMGKGNGAFWLDWEHWLLLLYFSKLCF
jgi:hypothetical protein